MLAACHKKVAYFANTAKAFSMRKLIRLILSFMA